MVQTYNTGGDVTLQRFEAILRGLKPAKITGLTEFRMDTNHTIHQYKEAVRRLWGNYQMVVSANQASRKWGVALIMSRDVAPNDLVPHHMVQGRVLGVEVAVHP